ncbi:MAG TPA: glycosyltransferase family 39 protein [Thermoguttaceae bacterium]|nr:glycosyltransferase family 39 protein [Thermoguttaceae bacterium]
MTENSFCVDRRPDLRWSKIDWLYIAILAAACLAIRVPSLDAEWLGVDQQQYLATAAYLHATGDSAFSQPYGPTHTFELYRVLAALFGPYELLPVRVLVLLAAFAMSVLIFLIVRRAASRAYGLLAAVVFLGYNVFFEGLSANREWFAGPFVLLGMYLFLRCAHERPKRAWWWMAASGLSCGIAVWFKLQAVCMIGVVPAALAFLAWSRHRSQRTIAHLAAYTAGLAVAAVLFFLPFLAAGTAGDYLAGFAKASQDYVVRSGGLPPKLAAGQGLSQRPQAGLEEYFQAFYEHPFPAPLFAAYCLAGAWIVGVFAGVIRKRRPVTSRLSDPTLVVFVLYLLAAMFAVQLGRRFFPHYFLLMMPPVAVLFSLAVRWVVLLPRTRLAAGTLGSFCALFVLLEVCPPWSAASVWPWCLVPVVPTAAFFAAVFGRPQFCNRLVRAAVFAVVAVQPALAAASLPTVVRVLGNRGIMCGDESVSLTGAVSYLRSHGQSGDRLFVWGWRPELYTFSRLEPASSFTITSYIVQDARVLRTGRVEIHPERSRRLMRDLDERKPRFIVDASKCSMTMSYRWAYSLEYYAPLREHLQEHYEPSATRDGCDIYVRRDRHSPK